MNKENVNNSEVVNEVTNEVINEVTNDNYQNVIKKLLAGGCKRISKVRIKNVTVTDKDVYTMVSFNLVTPIQGYVSDDNGLTYKLGMTNTIFTSLYAITGALKEDEELGWMANALLENPQTLNLIFNGATIDIIQQHIPSGVEFINPFTTRSDANIQVYDHDIIINHIVKFNLGKTGIKMADKLADKLMGF